jgi:hypothetical protein
MKDVGIDERIILKQKRYSVRLLTGYTWFMIRYGGGFL